MKPSLRWGVFAGTALAAAALVVFLAGPAAQWVVRTVLVNNPEILLEAQNALQNKRQAQAEARQSAAIAQFRAQIFEDPQTPVVNPSGEKTMVEFFDYQCGYCKQVHPTVKALQKDDNLRMVKKEFPILGPGSLLAARYALAAHKQGIDAYEKLHNAMMEWRGPFNDATIQALATAQGLDAARLATDKEDAAIDAALRANHALAEALDIRGTPAFIIGARIVPGAADAFTLRQALAQAEN